MWLFGFVVVGVVIGYPTLGLKMPQKDNPVQYRKKYGTSSTIMQFQQLAMIEYGGTVEKQPDTNVLMSNKGFSMVGHGVRIDLDNYEDLIC